ncbi:MAG: hypothetical protein IJT98_11370 [Prevotella sp.]|nr:hypothetical protein [Prevotella sp.]
MKINNKQNDGENPFVNACQLLNQMSVSVFNWLQVAINGQLQTVRHEQGCMRSIRLAYTDHVSGMITRKSAVQIVLLPDSFDHPRPLGTDHPLWHLLIYSWLDTATTERLVYHLKEKAAGRIHCRLFRPDGASFKPVVTF